MSKLREKTDKIVLWKPDMRIVAGVLAAALIVFLVPLLRIAVYSVPFYDDYNFGGFVKNFLDEERSIGSALRGAIYCVKVQWYAWQGTYSATFFNSLMPAVWGEEYYFLGPMFLILILPISVCIFVRVLIIDVLRADRASCVAIQAIAASMIVVLLHSPQQGFFWYVGGMCYVGMHSFLLLLISAWIKLLFKTGKIRAVLLVAGTLIGAALAGGATYVTALQGLLIGLSILALGFFSHNKRTWLLLPSILVYGFGFCKNVMAPGNQVRSANYVGWGYSPAEAILRSFLEAFSHIGVFTGWITVAVLVFLAPIIWYMLGKSKFTFRLPGLVLAWSFCLYATGFTPGLYALGHAGLGRTLNAVKITYQLLAVINEVYWLGWLRLVRQRKGKPVSAGNSPWWFYGLMAGIMLFIFAFVSPSQGGCYSSYGAYYFVHTGEAYNFYHEYLERVESLKGSEKDVVVEPYHFTPWFLCISDLYADPNKEENRAMAAWYHKDSIACIAKEPEEASGD